MLLLALAKKINNKGWLQLYDWSHEKKIVKDTRKQVSYLWPACWKNNPGGALIDFPDRSIFLPTYIAGKKKRDIMSSWHQILFLGQENS